MKTTRPRVKRLDVGVYKPQGTWLFDTTYIVTSKGNKITVKTRK